MAAKAAVVTEEVATEEVVVTEVVATEVVVTEAVATEVVEAKEAKGGMKGIIDFASPSFVVLGRSDVMILLRFDK